MAESYYCEKCHKTMDGTQFYGSNNLEKYTDGKLRTCKKCMTMHVDNFNPDTYLWILQECDVPYVPKEWIDLLRKYGKDKAKLTGTTVLGRYLSKMKLKQWRDYRWKDNEFLQNIENAKIEETMKRQGYSASEIAQAIAAQPVEIPTGPVVQPDYSFFPESPAINANNNPFLATGKEDYFASLDPPESDNDFVSDLTEEDITYLKLKWGKTYKPEEWVRLEQLYEEMMASYDIQVAGHIDTLKLVCKASLKANQLIDIGDIEGFQKMQKAYDSLMKSGHFTAVQNQDEHGEFIDSIGELIDMCEKQGYIERYYVDSPKDKVDLTIADMQRYTKTLIEEETNLSIMVEKALREIEKEDKANAANKESEIIDDIDITLEELEATIKDQDFIDFDEFLEEENAADAEFYEKGDI